MTPKEYFEIRKQVRDNIERLERVLGDAFKSALQHPFPERVRPATYKDIAVGQVMWYRLDAPHWVIVDEVLDSDDRFKAFVSDGYRYGLDGALIEVD